jgi:TetR/AcrR family transcriptional repressor of uid operon
MKILKAAAKCFRKTGFHLASMQEICTETGLGPGAVYRYFPSKDKIIEAMAEEERSQVRIVLANLESQEFPDAITEITEALAERYLAIHDTGLMVEIYAERLRNKRVGSAVKKIESEWIERLTDLLRSAQVKNQIDPSLDPHTQRFF